MTSFDIDTLRKFEPPRYLCCKCCAIYTSTDAFINYKSQKIACPVCKIEYTPTTKFGIYGFDPFMKTVGAKIEYNELLHHMRILAHNANMIRIGLEEKHKSTTSPIKGLFALLGTAKHFVHFSSFGLGEQILGAMKIVAQSVPVRGIVSNVNEYLETELTDCKLEASNLNIKHFPRSNNTGEWARSSHTKLVIIDGLIAIKGSTNLTTHGWKQAKAGKDIVEIETDVAKVSELNNRYFSPTWAEFYTDWVTLKMTEASQVNREEGVDDDDWFSDGIEIPKLVKQRVNNLPRW